MPDIHVEILTPQELGARFVSMAGREGLSELYGFELEFTDSGKPIAKADLLGKPIAVALPLSGGGKRYFHGYVTRLDRSRYSADRAGRYHATLSPWLWLLTRSNNCRIFQDKTVPQIIEAVFGAQPYSSIKQVSNSLKGNYAKRTYCVQYRESDFAFVSRLMEEEGIAYYFVHESNKHTMVLVDSQAGFARQPDGDVIEYMPTGAQEDARNDQLDELRCFDGIESGQVALADFDFEKPSQIPRVNKPGADAGHDLSKLEWYDYPGGFLDTTAGDRTASIRMSERETLRTWIHGGHTARTIGPGYLFKIKGAPDFVPTGDLLAVKVSYEIGNFGEVVDRPKSIAYRSSFDAVPGSTPYRPPRRTPRPIVEGPQTAIVTGKSGKEIETDKYGRIKVQFHWDRLGKMDFDSSCWVRVAFPWAGKRFGFVTIPRVGDEVVVTFLEGDPDRPLVTGSVYNAEHMPPWTLDKYDVFSGIRSHTVSGGSSDFNEIRFSDKQGGEQIYVRAQKDYEARIENDRKEYVHHDADCKVDGDRRDSVKGKFHLKVDGDRLTKLGANDGLDVSQDCNIKTGTALSIKTGTDFQVKVGANAAVDAASDLHLKSMTMVLEAATMLTLKAGASTIVLGPAGITIDGAPLVQVNCGGAGGSGMGAHPSSPGAADDAKEASQPVS